MAEIGRNDDCPCGSGRKFKYCCGGNGRPMAGKPPKKNKVLTQQGLLKCFTFIAKSMGGLEIPCKDLDDMPPDEILAIKYDEEKDSFLLATAKVKRSPIFQPDGRLRRPVIKGN